MTNQIKHRKQGLRAGGEQETMGEAGKQFPYSAYRYQETESEGDKYGSARGSNLERYPRNG